MTPQDWLTFIIALIGAGAGTLIIQALEKRAVSRREDKLTDNKLKQSEFDRLMNLYNELEEARKNDCARLEAHIESLEDQLKERDEERRQDRERITELEEEVEELRAYMENHGLKPPPRRRRKAD